MMPLHEIWRLALRSLQAHRMRSALTALGIVIGVAAVVMTVALFEALSHSVTQQFEGMGSQSLTITARNEYQDIVRGRQKRLRLDDVDQLRSRVDSIRALSPTFLVSAGNVRFSAREAFGNIIATSASYQEVHSRFPQKGRFLSQDDDDKARHVAVIGVKLAEDLGLPEDPIGSHVQVGEAWFRIIGLMEKRGDLFGMSQDEFLFVPYRTGLAMVGRDKQVDLVIHAVLKTGSSQDWAKAHISQVLRQSHRLSAMAAEDFRVEASDQMAKSLESTSRSISLVLAAVVGVSLLVGGVGIMNIMLVSVTERTREIGICKALGARRRDILAQFLIEAVLLSGLGGVAGIVLGALAAQGAALLLPSTGSVGVPWWSAALAWSFSLATGVIFGLMPASKAAALEPVEALRFE